MNFLKSKSKFRAIFWVNSNHTSASLDRVEVDGTNHQQIVTKDISQPLGVTVDEAYGKVYWTDDRPGIYYRIERCSLDGTNRELLIHRTNQVLFEFMKKKNGILIFLFLATFWNCVGFFDLGLVGYDGQSLELVD